ncbi:molybdopterin molybdotransferase MoeA [Dongshaea marina]|uniref:molybdopterin molybdotransferase MoeA n=1 Tax=Dongshaea marina TaxID=2047966 RepID=UPI000D3E53D4|nr:molybdopterin molybdotransferase MoeA [Dongshaea marina]
MGCCDKTDLIPLEQARTQMLDVLTSCCSPQTLPLNEVDGMILAQDICAPLDIPPFDNSSMDGYAIDHASLISSSGIKIAGDSFAGHPFTGSCPVGEAVRIMTGAPLPAGTDTVIMQEEVERTGDQIQILSDYQQGQNVRPRGQDLKQGEKLLEQGNRLNARSIQLLASVGIDRVCVYRPLKVALLSSGDELKDPGSVLSAGEIFDSNRAGLKILLQRLHCECLDFGIIPDDKPQLRQAFLDANEQADVVISSGGVSVGEADYTRDVLQELGSIHFWKIALKPGKPFSFGKLPKAWFFGLPGNPVSAMVSFCQLVRPALDKLAGTSWQSPIQLQAKVTHPLRKQPGRTDYQRGYFFRDQQGKLCVTPASLQCSGAFRSMATANCFIVLPQEQGSIDTGQQVTVEPFDGVLS